MCAESVGLDFFLARLSGVPAARFLFVVGGEVRRLAFGFSLCDAVLSDLRLLPVLPPLFSGGCWAWIIGCSSDAVALKVGSAQGRRWPAHVTKGNECVVLVV